MSSSLPIQNAEAFLAAKADWENSFRQLLRESGNKERWEDWLSTAYENCQPFDTEITLLSKKASADDVGFSIHLCAHDPEKPEAYHYERTFGESTGKPIRHLVIAVEYTPSAKQAAQAILTEWLKARR